MWFNCASDGGDDREVEPFDNGISILLPPSLHAKFSFAECHAKATQTLMNNGVRTPELSSATWRRLRPQRSEFVISDS